MASPTFQRVYKCRRCGQIFSGEVVDEKENPYSECLCLHRCDQESPQKRGIGDFVGLDTIKT
jgi:DNA-directed RNA polymerase subunit RPC12/RpoP